MRNRIRQSIAMSGAALLAAVLVGTLPAWADDSQPAASPQAQRELQFEAMQARMQAMHAIMVQIQQATDPAVRRQLMDQEYQLMRAQMKDMGMMSGMMMGHGATGGGMTGGGMMGGGMMQPSTPAR